jgi:hypothetical protein
VDLLDAERVRAIVGEIRAAHGRIDVLVHAGGIEISRLIADKDPREFDRVFDVKAEGFFNLLAAAGDMPLGATVAFGSVAGRFGNAGQADYAAANALLCALTSHLRRARPQTRAIAIDWTAWAGIGMATRGSIPAVMAEAGVETLPPERGVPVVRRELTNGGGGGEVVVAGRLGAMAAPRDADGGLDVQALQARLAGRAHPLVMAGVPRAATADAGLVVETTLDPQQQPFLSDHRIDGVPVLPGVMGTEAFAEVAGLLCPGYRVTAVEDERFLVPFKFHRLQPAVLHLSAVGRPGAAGEVVVEAALRSRLQPRADLPPQEKVHFRARVRLAREAVPAPAIAFQPLAPERFTITAGDVYRVYFHGPAYRVLDGVAIEDGRAVGRLRAGLPPGTTPAEAEELMAPRLLELCFQTAGVWLLQRAHVMALPSRLGRVTAFRAAPGDGRALFAVVDARDGGETFDAWVVDEHGEVYVQLTDYRWVALGDERTLAA